MFKADNFQNLKKQSKLDSTSRSIVSGQFDGNESDRIKKDKLALTLSLFTYRKMTQQQIEELKRKEAQM